MHSPDRVIRVIFPALYLLLLLLLSLSLVAGFSEPLLDDVLATVRGNDQEPSRVVSNPEMAHLFSFSTRSPAATPRLTVYHPISKSGIS